MKDEGSDVRQKWRTQITKEVEMRGDGKGKFYRQCNLDKVTWQAIKAFRKVKRHMLIALSKKRKQKTGRKQRRQV